MIANFRTNGQTYSLRITDDKGVANELVYKKNHTSFKSISTTLEEAQKAYQLKGYLLAHLDTVITVDKTSTANFKLNEPYKFATIKIRNMLPPLQQKIGINEKLLINAAFSFFEIEKIVKKIIKIHENNGYPFCDVTIDSIDIESNSKSLQFNVTKNKYVQLDSINIIGNAKVNKKFLMKYLGIAEKMPYDEQSLRLLQNKIKQLPFLFEKQVQQVKLTQTQNKLLLFLDKKNASQFDGIVGILPDANTGRAVITGDVKLKVVNGVFRNGETFDLQWRRLQTQTSDFKGRIIYPYLFGTSIGTDYSLKLYRKDTTFIDIQNNIGIQYYLSGLNSVKAYYKIRNNNLLSTSGYSFVTVLPEFADISTNSYGAGLNFEKYDYRFNPKKGFGITLNLQTGNRRIKKNPKINEAAYIGLLLNSVQYQYEAEFTGFINLRKQHVLKLNLQSAAVFGNSTLFKNELFRIGGLRTLRGFDEESIFASTYVIPTIEYRFVFSQNSNLLLFSEGAWYENNSQGVYLKDIPFSIGTGINFDTKAGILSINYALGNQFNNGFDARNGKIHIGLVALF